MKPSKTLFLILLIALVGACWLSVHAADKDYALADAEQQQWAQLNQIEKNANDAYQTAIVRAVNTPVGEQSKEVHAAVQSGWLAVGMVTAQKKAFLAQLQADHDCKGCQIIGNTLTKPKS